MSDFWKGVISVLTLQWLFGGGKDGGCGCSGCFTALVLGACFICYILGLFE
ncbi:MAG: hypothetical protein HDS72_10685 [Bacteroidales bacterium]|nr:hypothetical protein [Bacteroidales bacterium]